MHNIDIFIFVFYMLVMVGIGIYFNRKNTGHDDYYAGGRGMGSGHIGLSVVATDVGGGFSIGLGGLGFAIGISGSWMLFTGLIGAWLSAIFLIPVVYPAGRDQRLLSFPQWLQSRYNKRVAIIAGVISGIGYLGFTASQMLAGAKLASGVFPELDLHTALFIMGGFAIVYTALGGLKAVIYTDSIQWLILLIGLVFVGLQLGYASVGGMDAIRTALPAELLRLDNIGFPQILNWAVTIITIWFIGMTLYQRIYACKDEHTARKAWYIAGLFEYPVMAFMGVGLGLLSKVAAEQGMFAPDGFTSAAGMDAEIGLPIFLRYILPVGGMGIMLSAYFSAILSTADSCLMAASGNLVHDIIPKNKTFQTLKGSQLATLLLCIVALLLASNMQSVLDLMLHSYAIMVSGMFIPVVGLLFFAQPKAKAAVGAMISGGGSTLLLTLSGIALPFGFDPIIPGILISFIIFVFIQKMKPHGISGVK